MTKKNLTLDIFLGEKAEVKTQVQEGIRGPYELPKGWKWVKLGSIIYIRKETINPQEYPEEEFELYSIPAYHETGKPEIKLGREIRSTKIIVYPNDCLFGKLNPHIPKVWLVEPFKGRRQIASTELFPLVPRGKGTILPEFLFWFLKTPYFRDRMVCKVIGTTGSRKRLSRNDVLEELIPLPPIEEQKRIVARIKELMSRIEEAKRLRKLAKEETEKIMQAALHKVFREAEERGWKLARLNEIADVKYGKARPKEKGNVPVVGSGGIYAYTNKALVNFPTIVIGRKGTAGQVWMMNTPCWPSDTTFYLKWRDPSLAEPRFIFWYLKFAKLSGEKGKTTLPSLLRQDLENQIVPLPPLEEQKKIATYLDRLSEIIRSLGKLQQMTEKELEKLVPIILDKAFKGEL